MKHLGQDVKFLFREILCVQMFYCLILFLQFHITTSPQATITFYRYIYFYVVSASYQLASLGHRVALRSESMHWFAGRDSMSKLITSFLREMHNVSTPWDDSVCPSVGVDVKFRIRGVSINVDHHVCTVCEVLIYVKLKFVVECVAVLFGGLGACPGLEGVLLSAYFLERSCRFAECVVSHPEGAHRPLGPILIVFETAHSMNIVAS